MTSAVALWWLALPVLLLPIWWHRQKRQRTRSQPLATARFLPVAAPQQQRIWRWADRLLLLLRCLLLSAVIAWLADVVVPWRGDTVWLGPRLDAQMVQAQLKQAGMAQAQAQRFCAAGSDEPACDLRTDHILAWLAAHEREWQATARWLLIANAGDVPMPAHPPALAHRLDLRVQAASAPAARVDRHVVLVSHRAERWRALFTAFESAGLGNEHYLVTTTPNAKTELIVWDMPEAPDATWRAPLWWVTDATAFPALTQAARLQGLRYLDSAHGRLWALDGGLPADIDGARWLFQTWQALQRARVPYAPPSQVLAASAASPANPASTAVLPAGALYPVLAPLLAALFMLERLLAHVRRA